MQKIINKTAVLLLVLGLIAGGCSSSKKGQCGCPNKQGMVGYK